MFHEVWKLERLQTAKVTFKVLQGHWQWCHSIGQIRFPISVSLQLCILHRWRPLVSQNLRRSRDTSHIPVSCCDTLCNRKPSTWYILPAHKIWRLSPQPFRKYNCGRRIEKWVTWHRPRPFRFGLSSLGRATCVQNLTTLSLTNPEISLGAAKF